MATKQYDVLVLIRNYWRKAGEEVFKIGPAKARFVFQQDNVKPHTARKTECYGSSHGNELVRKLVCLKISTVPQKAISSSPLPEALLNDSPERSFPASPAEQAATSRALTFLCMSGRGHALSSGLSPATISPATQHGERFPRRSPPALSVGIPTFWKAPPTSAKYFIFIISERGWASPHCTIPRYETSSYFSCQPSSRVLDDFWMPFVLTLDSALNTEPSRDRGPIVSASVALRVLRLKIVHWGFEEMEMSSEDSTRYGCEEPRDQEARLWTIETDKSVLEKVKSVHLKTPNVVVIEYAYGFGCCLWICRILSPLALDIECWPHCSMFGTDSFMCRSNRKARATDEVWENTRKPLFANLILFNFTAVLDAELSTSLRPVPSLDTLHEYTIWHDRRKRSSSLTNNTLQSFSDSSDDDVGHQVLPKATPSSTTTSAINSTIIKKTEKPIPVFLSNPPKLTRTTISTPSTLPSDPRDVVKNEVQRAIDRLEGRGEDPRTTPQADKGLMNDEIIARPSVETKTKRYLLYAAPGIGCLIGLIPMIFLLKLCGSRITLAAALTNSAFLTAIIPVLSSYGFSTLFPIRVLLGVCFSPSLPVMGAVTANWGCLNEQLTFYCYYVRVHAVSTDYVVADNDVVILERIFHCRGSMLYIQLSH
ncbi:hypothetical protein KIN20_032913 [Parelaphostrongylus tenuis]|uniref:Uncharacterized protein n=1 Tax=Parelaphostrongylus tenuis TaxID=148309 RepID=A0AAD5WHU0_PARTN|nr:hypothetical protein KIN20_032913 [Parelaphostrongylus tenuis]